MARCTAQIMRWAPRRCVSEFISRAWTEVFGPDKVCTAECFDDGGVQGTAAVYKYATPKSREALELQNLRNAKYLALGAAGALLRYDYPAVWTLSPVTHTSLRMHAQGDRACSECILVRLRASARDDLSILHACAISGTWRTSLVLERFHQGAWR